MIKWEAEPREAAAIEADIARTRAAMNRQAQELASRLDTTDPGTTRERRPSLRADPQWIALGAIAAGAAMALAGWLKYATRDDAETDLEDLVIFESSRVLEF